MIPIIRKAFWERIEEYVLSFVEVGHESSGFSFPCDKYGRVDSQKLSKAGRRNWTQLSIKDMPMQRATMKDGRVLRLEGIKDYSREFRRAKVGKCYCGKPVCLSGFTNTCEKCGREYSSNGSLLVARRFWGEETGEHPSEVDRPFRNAQEETDYY